MQMSLQLIGQNLSRLSHTRLLLRCLRLIDQVLILVTVKMCSELRTFRCSKSSPPLAVKNVSAQKCFRRAKCQTEMGEIVDMMHVLMDGLSRYELLTPEETKAVIQKVGGYSIFSKSGTFGPKPFPPLVSVI